MNFSLKSEKLRKFAWIREIFHNHTSVIRNQVRALAGKLKVSWLPGGTMFAIDNGGRTRRKGDEATYCN